MGCCFSLPEQDDILSKSRHPIHDDSVKCRPGVLPFRAEIVVSDTD